MEEDFFDEFDEFDEFDDVPQNDEWHPRFPIDLEHPVELTAEQQERAQKIFDAVSAFMDAHPDETHPPMISITQEWGVKVNYGGWHSDSDFLDDALCVMNHDDEGFFLDPDYVGQCVPHIEKKLEENARWCEEEYGEVPDSADMEQRRELTLGNRIFDILGYLMDCEDVENFKLEIDSIEHTVYPVAIDAEEETYGGIIKFIPATNFLTNGDIDPAKIDAFAAALDDSWEP